MNSLVKSCQPKIKNGEVCMRANCHLGNPDGSSFADVRKSPSSSCQMNEVADAKIPMLKSVESDAIHSVRVDDTGVLLIKTGNYKVREAAGRKASKTRKRSSKSRKRSGTNKRSKKTSKGKDRKDKETCKEHGKARFTVKHKSSSEIEDTLELEDLVEVEGSKSKMQSREKSGTKKSATKKSGTKKSATKKSARKKAGTKKSATKKSARKKAGTKKSGKKRSRTRK